MSVANSGNILSSSAIFHREDTFSNHLTSNGSDNVNTEDLVGGAVRENLDETFRVVDSLCSGVGHEGEASDLVGDAFGLEVFFGLANPGDFGVGVDNRGDAVVVNVDILNNE